MRMLLVHQVAKMIVVVNVSDISKIEGTLSKAKE